MSALFLGFSWATATRFCWYRPLEKLAGLNLKSVCDSFDGAQIGFVLLGLDPSDSLFVEVRLFRKLGLRHVLSETSRADVRSDKGPDPERSHGAQRLRVAEGKIRARNG